MKNPLNGMIVKNYEIPEHLQEKSNDWLAEKINTEKKEQLSYKIQIGYMILLSIAVIYYVLKK